MLTPETRNYLFTGITFGFFTFTFACISITLFIQQPIQHTFWMALAIGAAVTALGYYVHKRWALRNPDPPTKA